MKEIMIRFRGNQARQEFEAARAASARGIPLVFHRYSGEDWNRHVVASVPVQFKEDVIKWFREDERVMELGDAAWEATCRKDSDCHLDSTDTCVVCRVYHGDPCTECGERAYHLPWCERMKGGGR